MTVEAVEGLPSDPEESASVARPTGGALLRAVDPDMRSRLQPRGTPMTEGRTDAFKMMVKLAPDGSVLTAKGADSEDFAAVAAYASQLAELVGESLGIDGFREMDCEFRKGRCVIHVDDEGNTLGVRPWTEMPMAKIREVLGLH